MRRQVDRHQALTLSGKIMDFDNPDPYQIDLDDVATGLANVCRFSGQLSEFYSVAQHCLMVAAKAPWAQRTAIRKRGKRIDRLRGWNIITPCGEGPTP